VNAGLFIQWLLKWQHLAPGTQLSGEEGLLEVIRQLQGFEIPANAWEREILAKRVTDYDKDTLDRLCFSGQIGWGRLSPHPATLAETNKDSGLPNKKRVIPTSIAPITFFVRGETGWMAIHQQKAEQSDFSRLSHAAKSIYEYIEAKGASFFTDIVRGAGRLGAEVETGLWELVTAGLVTADGFDNLRALIDPRRRLDRRRRLQARYSGGRWSILHPGETLEHAQQMEAVCWMLLKRYGVVFRDLLAREKNLPRWRDLLLALRRLEDRGEIRGGRFIDGFLGEQFALPYAVDSLRAMKKQQPETSEIKIAAADPLNLAGIILPGARVTAAAGKEVVIQALLYNPSDK
jgi:ATP-dependent Lhr-like helicase